MSVACTGFRPGVCPFGFTNICPSGKRAESTSPACTANVVFPTPGIPSITWTGSDSPFSWEASTDLVNRCRCATTGDNRYRHAPPPPHECLGAVRSSCPYIAVQMGMHAGNPAF
jgi:hypothetical protein